MIGAQPMPIAGAPDGLAGQPAWYMLPRIAGVMRGRHGRELRVLLTAPCDPATDGLPVVEADLAAGAVGQLCGPLMFAPGDSAAPTVLYVQLPGPIRWGGTGTVPAIRLPTAGEEERWPIPTNPGEV